MKPRPTATEAERALLGGMMIDPHRIGDVLPLLKPADFHAPTHRALFELLVAMRRAGESIDTVSVPMRVGEGGRQDRFGGVLYVRSLEDACPSTVNLTHYAKAVRDVAIRRRLMDAADRLIEQAASGEDVAWTLAQAQAELARVHEGEEQAHGIGAVLEDVLDGMQSVIDGTATPGLPTGYGGRDEAGLDARLGGGLRPGELTILAARPAMGKSAFAMCIAVNVARQDHAVGVFSMEMRRQQLVTRLVPMFSGVPLQRVVDPNRTTPGDWDRIAAGADALKALPIWIDDTPNLKLEQLAQRARGMVARGAALIVIDYLTQMWTEGRNQVAEVGRNVTGLKHLARELDVPIICLAQLNRDLEKRANKRPIPADLRDSGEVEQAADCILFVYRDKVYNEEADAREMEIIIAKARMGQTCTVVLEWDGEQQQVSEGGPL
jgi:replicative DNA helicase